MNNPKSTKKTLLMERMEKDYADFKASMADCDGGTLFDLAPYIAAIYDVYSLVKRTDYVCEEYAAYLLTKDNPLYFLADEWKGHLEAIGEADFEDLLSDLMQSAGYKQYMPTALAAGLRQKHGADLTLTELLMLEVLEISRQILKRDDRGLTVMKLTTGMARTNMIMTTIGRMTIERKSNQNSITIRRYLLRSRCS